MKATLPRKILSRKMKFPDVIGGPTEEAILNRPGGLARIARNVSFYTIRSG